MNRLVLGVFLILGVIQVAYGIKCYMCGGTGDACSKSTLESNKDKYLKTCTSPLNMCARTWYEVKDVTTIANLCTTQAACDVLKKACDNNKEGKCAVGCCDSDACNAATPVSFSLLLMTVCSVFGLILLK